MRLEAVPVLRSAGLLVGATALFAALVYTFDTSLALAAAVALVGALMLMLHPEAATLIVVFLLYSNIPSVLLKLYGLPEAVAGSFILLLGLPLVHFLVFRRQRARTDLIFTCMIVLLCTMMISSLIAKDKSLAGARIEKYVFEGMLLYWLVLNTVRDLTTLRRVIWATLLAGSMLGTMSIYQSVTGDFSNQFGGLAERNLDGELEDAAREEPVIREAKVRNVMRADGPQLGKNRYAQVMLVLVPLAWLQLRNARSRRGRLAALAMGGIILIGGVGLTYSRGAYLAGVVMIGFATFVARWIKPSQLAVGALCGMLALPIVAPLAVKRVTTLTAVTELDNPAEADGSLRGRATEMLAALNVLLDHPVLGVGPGQYMPFYSIDYHQRSGIKFRDIQVQRRAHMLYFELGAEGGIVGLTAFLVIPFILLRELGRARRYWEHRRPDYANFAGACCIGIIGFLATSVFLSYAFYRFYWFLIALSGTTLFLLRTSAESAERPARPRATTGAPVVGSVSMEPGV
jgi:putative inorganic carbon (hco3(-)) transporter